jgi:carbon storage regulator CsrA
MLVLSRKVGQRVVIDGRITLVINQISGNRVAVGIEAPDDVHIIRGELKRQWEDSSCADEAVGQVTACGR